MDQSRRHFRAQHFVQKCCINSRHFTRVLRLTFWQSDKGFVGLQIAWEKLMNANGCCEIWGGVANRRMRGEEDDADDADLSTSAGIIYKARVASHRKQHTTCTKWGFFVKWTRTTRQLRILRSYISFKSRYEDLCRHCCISCILHTRTCIIQIHIRLNKLKGFRCLKETLSVQT